MWSIKIKIGKLYLLLALDEPCDITDTSQFLIFIRGINDRFEIIEELFSVFPLKNTTTGEDFFKALQEVLQKQNVGENCQYHNRWVYPVL